jgi:hypothetical protein
MPYTVVDLPAEYFETKLYTGNGSTQTISGLNFAPEWVWLKGRSVAYSSGLFDIIRGTGKHLTSNNTNAEATAANTLTAFNSDGFSLGNEAGFNENGSTFCSWNWKANGAGVSNTSGTITSTVSANTTSGFSIVSYTNPASGSPFTVGHGLGVAPKMIIVKTRNVSQTWGVWHTSIGFGNYLRLDSTAATAAANLVTATSSTTFSTYQNHHATSDTLIAYCFAEVKGFSKFGSYTGNGSTDGTFVYTGFKPAFVMTKESSGTSHWIIHDTKRSPNNEMRKELYANLSNAEAENARYIDCFSNGFKIRSDDDTQINGSGATYIYMAFADSPFVSSKGIPTTAR